MNNRKTILPIIIALMIIGITAGCVNKDVSKAESGKQTIKNETPALTETPSWITERREPEIKNVSPAPNSTLIPISTPTGTPIPTNISNKTENVTSIVDIIANPNAYLGKTVTVKGRPSGDLNNRMNNGLVYTVEEISLNKNRFIDVATRMYPKERLECIREISVTGQVQYMQYKDKDGWEVNKLAIVEQSREVLYIFDAC